MLDHGSDEFVCCLNSVMSDLIMIVIVIANQHFLFVEEIYDEKSDRQMLWQAFLRKSGIKHAPEQLSVTARTIEDFLIEPLSALHKGVEFNKEWKAPEGWK